MLETQGSALVTYITTRTPALLRLPRKFVPCARLDLVEMLQRALQRHLVEGRRRREQRPPARTLRLHDLPGGKPRVSFSCSRGYEDV